MSDKPDINYLNINACVSAQQTCEKGSVDMKVMLDATVSKMYCFCVAKITYQSSQEYQF